MTSSAAAQSEPTSTSIPNSFIRNFNPPLPRICIGNINPGQLYYGFVQSVVDAQIASYRFDRPIDIIMKPSGPYLDAERNMVVEAFYNETKADVLVFVDSDITFTWEQLTTLAGSCTPQHPVVGGIYINPFRHHGVKPVVFAADNEQVSDFLPMTIEEIQASPQPEGYIGPLRKVGAIGTGFMAIHRSLLKSMIDTWGYPMPWFIENIVNGTHMGEDLCFCLRVQDMGFPVLCHTDVQLPHTKLINFTMEHHITAEKAKASISSSTNSTKSAS